VPIESIRSTEQHDRRRAVVRHRSRASGGASPGQLIGQRQGGDAMSIQPIQIEVCGRAVSIRLAASNRERLHEWNDRIAIVLELLISADVVKWYKNRVDWFLVFPQNGIEPAELLVELKKRLAGEDQPRPRAR
jgi:hypothetical protein